MLTEEEIRLLTETEQRAKSNSHRIDGLSEEIKEVKSNQKALYQIATSVGVIAQRVSNIEQKVDETNRKVDEQNKALKNAELKIDENAHEPALRTYDSVNKAKAAFIAAAASIVAGGVIGAIVAFIK